MRVCNNSDEAGGLTDKKTGGGDDQELAAGYARVSTEDETTDPQCDAQLADLRGLTGSL